LYPELTIVQYEQDSDAEGLKDAEEDVDGAEDDGAYLELTA